jgi:hypothetical protein
MHVVPLHVVVAHGVPVVQHGSPLCPHDVHSIVPATTPHVVFGCVQVSLGGQHGSPKVPHAVHDPLLQTRAVAPIDPVHALPGQHASPSLPHG